jgi:hypothetical protein
MKTLNFKDPIYLAKFKVVIFDSVKDLNEYAGNTNPTIEVRGGVGVMNTGTIQISLLTESDINTVAHECWHALEHALFIKSKVNLSLDGGNEHIAYYLGWLTEKVWDFLQKTHNNPEKLDKKDESIVK